ncbi:hypothetical protein [Massilia sp. TS11]|uniref:lipase family protein n=1 Tax=Massilia sp. TS11 TaxID=2908003 RepID=UPI001EDB9FBE|nr:hypothetical protein [Massilia sp. TS11]MCG2584845.1 hypothetical protein [Massilia sp. TS11]
MAYDLFQSTFLMSWAANDIADASGSAQALTDLLSVALSGGTAPNGSSWPGFFANTRSQLVADDFNVSWGPRVCLAANQSSGYAANAMYVAYSPSLNTYVVAIAATNPDSVYDWIDEDGDVAPEYMAPFPVPVPFVRSAHLPPLPEVPHVSAATALGISNLMQMSSGSQSLLAYLQSRDPSGASLIFTGHSLAGALSPTLALQIWTALSAAGSPWQASQIKVLPTAGATPGNLGFAASFRERFPATPGGTQTPAYANWNVDHWNQADIVPYAWNLLGNTISANLDSTTYDSIYGVMEAPIGSPFNDAVAAAIVLATPGFYTRISDALAYPAFSVAAGYYQWTQNSDGSFAYPPVWTALPTYDLSNPITTADQLGLQFYAGHIDEYLSYFNVAPPPKMPKAAPSQG